MCAYERVFLMKTAYLDCFSGISGDMFLGALVDAGLPIEEIRHYLKSLPLENFEIHATKELRSGITGTKITIEITPGHHTPRNLEDIKNIIEKAALDTFVREKSIEIFENLAEVEASIHGQSINEIHFHEVGATDSIIDVVGTVYGVNALKINPRLDVVARVHHDRDVELLKGIGASEVVRPEFEASLELTRHTLQRFGVPSPEIRLIINGLRRGTVL